MAPPCSPDTTMCESGSPAGEGDREAVEGALP